MLVPELVRVLQGKREQARDCWRSWCCSFSEKDGRFQIQEELMFPLEPESGKWMMSQPRGDWAEVTSSCLWRVSLWFSGMSIVYLRQLIIQFPIITTNARSKSTYEGEKLEPWLRVLEVSEPGWLAVLLRGLLPGSTSCQSGVWVAETAANLKKDIEKKGSPGLQHGHQRRILHDLTTTTHRWRNRSRLPGGLDEHPMSKSE